MNKKPNSFNLLPASAPNYIRGATHKYFNFQYYIESSDDFEKLSERWRGREQILERLSNLIIREEHDWCDALRPEDQPHLPHLPLPKGGISSAHGTKPYIRDLRGLNIVNLNISQSLNALDWAYFDWCEFSNCNFLMGEKGRMLFFFSELSHCKFISSTFRNGNFFEGTMKNTVFYDCSFENVEFNANGKDKNSYSNIVFINCKFNNVNLNRVDLGTVCFVGNCHFEKLKVDNEDLMQFGVISSKLLKVFQKWDEQDWPIRKKIKSITYPGTNPPIVNMLPDRKTQPYKNKFASLQASITGLIKFYEYVANSCDNHTHREVFSRAHYVLCWLIDQKRILASPLKGRIRAIPGRYITGYGDRPGIPVAAWLVSMVFFGILCGVSGIRVGGNDTSFATVLATGNFEDLAVFIWECIYFSVITATTVGYGDITPTPGVSMLFSASNAAIGMFLFTTFTVVIVRRLLR